MFLISNEQKSTVLNFNLFCYHSSLKSIKIHKMLLLQDFSFILDLAKFFMPQNLSSNCLLCASWRFDVWWFENVATSSHFFETSNYSASYSHLTRIHWSFLPEGGLKPPSVSFKVKDWRGNWASMLAPTMERRGCLFFFQDFWREPKSVADGRRMRLRDNLGRAWKASQEAAALKCWAGLHWIKGRRPPPYAPHHYA